MSEERARYDRSDPQSIERYAKRLVGRRIGDIIDIAAEERQGTQTKGYVGQHYERYFGLTPNSSPEPDFVEAGVELKTVPLKRAKAGPYSAKERTFITAIDYQSILDEEFEGSALDRKTRHVLYVFYEWLPDAATHDLRTLGVFLHARDEIDELMLREVHAHVRELVRAGRAHELSEGATWGVGAATKDTGGRFVDQPFSTEPARRRAFAWKTPYTTRLWQAVKPRTSDGLLRVDVPDDLAQFRADVLGLVRPWVGASVREMRDQLAPSVSDGAKNVASIVSRRMLGSEGKRDIEAFRRLGITVRTTRVDPRTYKPHEDVSFPAFDPRELVSLEWETSALIEHVTSMFFVVFEAPKERGVLQARLRTAFFWRPTSDELRTMGEEWTRLREAFARSMPEARPQASETQILHVRPHGRNATDTLPLPNGRRFVKSSFWLNSGFVQALVQHHVESGEADGRP